MLYRGRDMFRLDAANVAHRNRAPQKWILPEILEVSSVQRCPIKIYARTQQVSPTPGLRISSKLHSKCKRQIAIPGSCQPDAARIGNGWRRNVRSERSVRHLKCGNSQPRYGVHAESVFAANEVNLLVERHFPQQIGNARLDRRIKLAVDAS